MQRSPHRSIWHLFQYLSNHLDFDTMIPKSLRWICSRLNTNKILSEGDWIKWHWHNGIPYKRKSGNSDFHLKTQKPPRGPVHHSPCDRLRHPSFTFWDICSTTGNNGPGGALAMYEECQAKATQESCLRTEHHSYWSVNRVSECCFEFITTKLHSCTLPHPFAAHTLKFQKLLWASQSDLTSRSGQRVL